MGNKYFDRLFRLMVSLLLIIFCTASALYAERATVDEMDLTCQNLLNQVIAGSGNWAGKTDPRIERVEELTANDTVLARIYSINPEGFVVVPVLKDLPPIKAYYETGFFDVNETQGIAGMIRDVLQQRVREFVRRFGSIEASQPDDDEKMLGPIHRQQWDLYTLSESEFLQKVNEKALLINDSAGPLLTSRWHQNWPYNDYCPIGCNSNHCLVGCVSTAMSQLMAYYNWPLEGYGSKRYRWEGDYSCTAEPCVGSQYLEVEFNDPYDWDNIPDYCSNCSEEEQEALAELNYEVGVACSMDYGVCGSGANPDASVLPNYFRYKNDIVVEYRFFHDQESWYELVKNDIDVGRPLLYYIIGHAIVCDGYKDLVGIILYYHMNYGWGGSNNIWYVLDDLYYPLGGNESSDYLFRNISPDKRAWFTADTTVGWAPFEVTFAGESDIAEVRSWSWNFGDGGSANVQNPTHIFENSGLYDCTLKVIDMGWNSYYCPKQNNIIILADTVTAGDVTGPFDSTLEIAINITNSQPLYRLDIPIEWDSNLELQFMGHTLEGCRTETFEFDSYINYNSAEKRLCMALEAGSGDTLEVGTGPVLIIKFKILSAPEGKTVTLQTDGYTGNMPFFYSTRAEYAPMCNPGSITYDGCCIGYTGNVDCSVAQDPDITDITRLIDYLYLSRNPLCCLEEADCDGSGGEPDITDITGLIDYLYLSHSPLSECPN